MNVYFLLEGKSTETEVYPKWLDYLVPELTQVSNYKDVTHNNYYLFSSNGIPSIYTDLIAAIQDINQINKYKYLVICLDADELTVDERISELYENIKNEEQLNKTKLKIIVQNRCIETWFLGNRYFYTKNPHNHQKFIEYSKFYNVYNNDPELMKKPDTFKDTDSKFHVAYLRAMFTEKGMIEKRRLIYNKSYSKEIQKKSYLAELKKRIDNTPTHLKTFTNFINFCTQLRSEISHSR
ncbi:MAG: hypothetical protein HQK91_08355 [Nitrospirae bacterium]|nr:hypothetical protein [Nitrospirota bacterium]